MERNQSGIRKSFAFAAIALGLSVAVSGCDVAAALRHEDTVAQSVDSETQAVDSETQAVDSATQGTNSSSGGGASLNTSEPDGQHWTDAPTENEICEWDGKTLTGIRVGRHEGFDRIVFDLSGDSVPCYRIFFDANPMQDGSGNPVDVGSANQALRVEISALGPDFPTIPPGYSAQNAGPHVSHAFFDTFFEGTATNFIAVPNGAAQYSVQVLPGKLVIDVR